MFEIAVRTHYTFIFVFMSKSSVFSIVTVLIVEMFYTLFYANDAIYSTAHR